MFMCMGSGKNLCTEKKNVFLFSSSFVLVSLLPLVTFDFDPKTCSYKQEEGTMTQWGLCYANALSYKHLLSHAHMFETLNSDF